MISDKFKFKHTIHPNTLGCWRQQDVRIECYPCKNHYLWYSDEFICGTYKRLVKVLKMIKY